VRISCADGSFGTGFLIAGDRIVTNHHVIGSEEAAAGATIEFNAQSDVDGKAAPTSAFRLHAARFATSASDDLSVVAVAGEPSRTFRPLSLAPRTVAVSDRVNIIQHPAGGEKQLSYFHNVVTDVGERRLQYLTDTMPGSSGSPVFDKEWNLVGVHHSFGWSHEASLTSGTYYRNQGSTLAALRELAVEAGGHGGGGACDA
jgi:V8-like Glu-specific endopeptidase